MKNTYYKSVMKLLPLWAVCALWCLGTHVSAQTATPIGAEFYGEWTFDHAQAQERPLRSQDPFTLRTVTKNDLQQNNYFYEVPTQITFMEEGAQLSGIYFMKNGTAYIEPYADGNLVQFVEPHEMTEEELLEGMDIYEIVTATFYNLTISGNTLSLQYLYFYGTGEEPGRTYTDGILTVYYSK